MAKLTAKQEETLQYLKNHILWARQILTTKSWDGVNDVYFGISKDGYERWQRLDTKMVEYWDNYYKEHAEGKVLCHKVDKRSLKKLQELGYIENWEIGASYSRERVKVNLEMLGIPKEW